MLQLLNNDYFLLRGSVTLSGEAFFYYYRSDLYEISHEYEKFNLETYYSRQFLYFRPSIYKIYF